MKVRRDINRGKGRRWKTKIPAKENETEAIAGRWNAAGKNLVNARPRFGFAGALHTAMETLVVLITDGDEIFHGVMKLGGNCMDDERQVRQNIIRRLLHNY